MSWKSSFILSLLHLRDSRTELDLLFPGSRFSRAAFGNSFYATKSTFPGRTATREDGNAQPRETILQMEAGRSPDGDAGSFVDCGNGGKSIQRRESSARNRLLEYSLGSPSSRRKPRVPTLRISTNGPLQSYSDVHVTVVSCEQIFRSFLLWSDNSLGNNFYKISWPFKDHAKSKPQFSIKISSTLFTRIKQLA